MRQRRDFLVELQRQMQEVDYDSLPEDMKRVYSKLQIEIENRLLQISTDIESYVDEWVQITKELATYDIQDAVEIKNRGIDVNDYSINDINQWVNELLNSSENLREFQEATRASTRELVEFIGQVTDDADAAKLSAYYSAMDDLKLKRGGMSEEEYAEFGGCSSSRKGSSWPSKYCICW